MEAPNSQPTTGIPPLPAVPVHVAIIMDGNGRWAEQRGLPRIQGHEHGVESVRAVVRACKKVGVKYLTLYAFSVENWARPKQEIDALMNLLKKFLRNQEHELHEKKIRLRVIGRITDLPKSVRRELTRTMKATEPYKEGQLILALSYGGRTEIAHAAQEIARRVRDGQLKIEEINEQVVTQHLYAPDLPDPDLLIRTSAEMRVSNFLLWQLAYTELYVTDVLWPDFREEHFMKAIEEYGRRRRRFGNIR